MPVYEVIPSDIIRPERDSDLQQLLSTGAHIQRLWRFVISILIYLRRDRVQGGDAPHSIRDWLEEHSQEEGSGGTAVVPEETAVAQEEGSEDGKQADGNEENGSGMGE
jgi:hypothetical protein